MYIGGGIMFIRNGKYRIFLKVRKLKPICFSFERKAYDPCNAMEWLHTTGWVSFFNFFAF
jgi:hypothetical protein